MQYPQPPKKILCIHDLSGLGRCSLAVILPVLSAMGHQVICLPTAVLSTHTGGFGTPARMESDTFGRDALNHYAEIGVSFDCIYSGYMATPAQAALADQAFALWPDACKVVDPAMGDGGRLYGSLDSGIVAAQTRLAWQADLVLPNVTEAHLILGRPLPDIPCWSEDAARQLACDMAALCRAVVITGLPMGKFLGCAGAGKDTFVQKKPFLSRSYPGTGDLFAAVLIGLLLRGNVLSAAAEAAACFVSECIQNTDPGADPRCGVWFEPLLRKLIF